MKKCKKCKKHNAIEEFDELCFFCMWDITVKEVEEQMKKEEIKKKKMESTGEWNYSDCKDNSLLQDD